MRLRSIASTLLIGVACSTGLAACGGSDDPKVSDAAFVDKCTNTIAKDATLKAYSTDICKCVQDTLKAQGLGDKKNSDKTYEPQAKAAGATCTRKVLTGK